MTHERVRVAELLADAARRVAVGALGVAGDERRALRFDDRADLAPILRGQRAAPGTCARAQALASTHAIARRRVTRAITIGSRRPRTTDRAAP
jgi:hypothetical protein